MSIEIDLKRIADASEAMQKAVESILQIMSNITTISTTAQTTPSMVKPEVQTEAVKEQPVKEQPAKEQSAKEPTDEEIRNAVREYMQKTDKQAAIELLIKYGADREKPMIKDVKHKFALLAEIRKHV